MNNRQAGAHREMIRKEERARELWEKTNMANYAPAEETLIAPQQEEPAPIEYGASGAQQYPQAESLPGMGRSMDTSIYDTAIRISSPRMVDEGAQDYPNAVERKVIRQVEVPYMRRVKVPVKTRKIIPIKVQKKVLTKKLVEVPSTKNVEEQYTEIVEQPAIREKEIWVKKIVPERYMKKVPVTRTRTVQVPTTVIKEVDDYEIVEVGGSKAIEVDGYRVDEVEDSKLVEVEEFQTYELKPHATGLSRLNDQRELGPVRQLHHSRRVGNQVFHTQDERIREIDEDSAPDDVQRSSLGATAGRRATPLAGAGRQMMSSQKSLEESKQQSQSFTSTAPAAQSKLGCNLRNTNSNGVVVYKVDPGGASERAGLHVNDVIEYANNRPTRNLTEFRAVSNNSVGPLYLQVRRRGVRKLQIAIQR